MSDTRYLISEASKKAGVETHVLRYWEEELQLPIARNEMGHRYYTKQDIQVFLSIKELKRRGFQLKTIKELVPKLEESAYVGMVQSVDSREKPAKQQPEQKVKKTSKEQNKKAEVKELNQFKEKNKKTNVQPIQKHAVRKEIKEPPNIKVLVPREIAKDTDKPEQPKQKKAEIKDKKDNQPVKNSKEKSHEERQQEFYQIMERLFQQVSGEKHSEERYKRLDAAIRKHQYSRRLVAATEEQGEKRKKKYSKAK